MPCYLVVVVVVCCLVVVDTAPCLGEQGLGPCTTSGALDVATAWDRPCIFSKHTSEVET